MEHTLRVTCDVEWNDAHIDDTDVPRVVHLHSQGHQANEQVRQARKCALRLGSTTPPFSSGIMAVVPTVSANRDQNQNHQFDF